MPNFGAQNYEHKVQGQDLWKTSRGYIDKKWLITDEVIVRGQWGAGEIQSKGVRMMEGGKGGGGQEKMGEAEADDTWRTKTG